MAKRVGKCTTGVIRQEEPPWANSTEEQFAALLNSYGIAWQHEPHKFPIAFDEDGNPTPAGEGFELPPFRLEGKAGPVLVFGGDALTGGRGQERMAEVGEHDA